MLFETCEAETGFMEYIVDPYHTYSYEEMLGDAAALQRMYPDIISIGSIGRSVEGREILLIKLGNGDRNIFVNGSIHACEYISTSYLMYMLDRYAYAYSTSGTFEEYNLKEILNSVTFCVAPMLNPDGVNLVQNGLNSVKNPERISGVFTDYADWKANINGVDLNRNFDNKWYVSRPNNKPGPAGYKGNMPLSEPESQAIANYLNSEMCWTYISFHSKGEGIYGWDDSNSSYYPQLDSMVLRILEAGNYRRFYDTPETDYGTFLGYVRDTFLKPALTIELCKYVYRIPYPDEDFDSVWEPAKAFCLIVAEEVMEMGAQEYLVFQNNKFLHAFNDEDYANAYARKWRNSRVVYIQGGIEKLVNMVQSDVSVFVNGMQTELAAYSINGNNYYKIRDLAAALDGTRAQFDVLYDNESGAVILATGQPYCPQESTELVDLSHTTAAPSDSDLYLNGERMEVSAFNINGSNYYRLRDIAAAVDFGVSYEHESRTVSLDTMSGYE